MSEEKVSAKQRFEIFKRDNFTCQYCGKKSPEVILEVDHIIPIAEGGKSNQENLTTACFACNRGKGARLLDSVFKDRDLHSETLLLAEREMQLKEYNYILEKVKEREDADLEYLNNYFVDQFYQNHQYRAGKAFQRAVPTIREALKIMSYIEILQFLDYSVSRTEYDRTCDHHYDAAAKYLCGILRNKLKESHGSQSDH